MEDAGTGSVVSNFIWSVPDHFDWSGNGLALVVQPGRKVMRRETKKRVKKAIAGLGMAALTMSALMLPVFASGAGGTVTSGITTLKNTLITIVEAIGVIVIVWGILELGKAFTQHDSASKIQAMGPLIGGSIMVAAGIVVTLFT